MNRNFNLFLFIALIIGIQPVFTQNVVTVSTSPQYDVPQNVRNNQFFLESQRLARLAQEMYDHGDYDASIDYAHQAIHYTLLSDVYVAITMAKSRIDWAVSSGASRHYPDEFGEAESWYSISLKARDAEEWENAINAAHNVFALLAYIDVPVKDFPLPAKYTVREWVSFKDCFWNIAGRSWAYGDPQKWRLLYDANKSKLPNPNNPDLIEPGIVLDIPSLKGEIREGEWDSERTYTPIQ
jgi:hypothetical protein